MIVTIVTRLRFLKGIHINYQQWIRNSQTKFKSISKKDWKEIKSADSWQIFKVMSEFVEGLKNVKLNRSRVSIFGSARTKEGNPYYTQAEEIAFQLTKGYGVISGGASGIMGATNKGAQRGGGKSVGLNTDLPLNKKVIHLLTLIN